MKKIALLLLLSFANSMQTMNKMEEDGESQPILQPASPDQFFMVGLESENSENLTMVALQSITPSDSVQIKKYGVCIGENQYAWVSRTIPQKIINEIICESVLSKLTMAYNNRNK